MAAIGEPVGAVAHTCNQHEGGEDRQPTLAAALTVRRAFGVRGLETGLVFDLIELERGRLQAVHGQKLLLE
jgi:hypothetical protein